MCRKVIPRNGVSRRKQLEELGIERTQEDQAENIQTGYCRSRTVPFDARWIEKPRSCKNCGQYQKFDAAAPKRHAQPRNCPFGLL